MVLVCEIEKSVGMADEKKIGMLKKEYAQRVGIPYRTMARYMNVHFLNELKEIDYSISQKYLTPKQIAWLDQKLVVC